MVRWEGRRTAGRAFGPACASGWASAKHATHGGGVRWRAQVEGKDGLQKLRAKIKVGGPGVVYHGALGAMSATFVGHYPWFYTYNKLNEALPAYDRKTNLPMFLARNAAIGFCCSAISDTCSNSIRVIKTTKQVPPQLRPPARRPPPPSRLRDCGPLASGPTHTRAPATVFSAGRLTPLTPVPSPYRQTSTVPITYMSAVSTIVAKDGVSGLLFRGLVTKIISNGCQGILFSVLWRLGQDYMNAKDEEKKKK